jgi:hypothetical protein
MGKTGWLTNIGKVTPFALLKYDQKKKILNSNKAVICPIHG